MAVATPHHASSDEEAMILSAVRELVAEKVAPRAAEIDERGEYPQDIRKLFAENDLLGIPIPTEYGGLGGTFLTYVKVVEEIAKACASSSLIVAVQELGMLPILIGGSEEQKKKYLPKIASGEWIAAYALTEAGSGSDAAGSMRTRAEKRGDKWILNGQKIWITNGSVADVICVFAVTDPEKGPNGISAFIVEKTFPGFQVGKLEKKMGIRGSPTVELVFDNCEVPEANLIGPAGDGFKIAMKVLDKSRPGIAAQALGIAAGALDYAANYARERIAFGKPIGQQQGISAFIVEKTFPGFQVGKLEKKMGIRGSPTVELVFDNCEVPEANLIGPAGDGFKIAMKVLDKSRPGIAAQALGIAAGALDYAANYARERIAFGKPIGQQQGVGFMLADMKTEVEAARLLLYEAARKCDEGAEDVTLWAAMCKLKCGDVAMSVTTDAVQVLGGFGYSVEYPVERMMRDAKITQIYEGTQQIQRLVISRSLVGKWKAPAKT